MNPFQIRKAAHNNASLFARFAVTAALKLAYYHLLVRLYRCAGRTSDLTVANGSWTAAHLRKLWGVPVRTVFPPCDTFARRHIGPSAAEAQLMLATCGVDSTDDLCVSSARSPPSARASGRAASARVRKRSPTPWRARPSCLPTGACRPAGPPRVRAREPARSARQRSDAMREADR